MWFWYFWGISTAICFIIMLITERAMANRLKRKFSKEEIKLFSRQSISEEIIAWLPFALPFVNLLIVIICIFNQDVMYEKLVAKIAHSVQDKGE